MMFEVVFAGDRLRLLDSGCVPAGATAEGTLLATALRDADPAAAPPEIRTVSGETLFVPAGRRGELELFCRDNQIPLRVRPDVWGDLLEPFLDTEPTDEERAATLGRLNRVGLGAAEVAAIREEVAPLVLAYNAVHRDWHHLGLADLLDAATAVRLPGVRAAEPAGRAGFFSWAMRIADLGAAR